MIGSSIAAAGTAAPGGQANAAAFRLFASELTATVVRFPGSRAGLCGRPGKVRTTVRRGGIGAGRLAAAFDFGDAVPPADAAFEVGVDSQGAVPW
jgi:hypothetical protein